MTHPPADGPEGLLEELTSSYRGHLRVYERWLHVAEQAVARLDAGELEQFLQVHEQKQLIADGLREQEVPLRHQRDHIAQHLQLEQFTVNELLTIAPSLPDKEAFIVAVQRWQKLLDDLSGVMQRVAKIERQIEVKLREHLRSLSDSVSDARTTRRAVRAYHHVPEGDDARFIDRKG